MLIKYKFTNFTVCDVFKRPWLFSDIFNIFILLKGNVFEFIWKTFELQFLHFSKLTLFMFDYNQSQWFTTTYYFAVRLIEFSMKNISITNYSFPLTKFTDLRIDYQSQWFNTTYYFYHLSSSMTSIKNASNKG